MCQEYHCDCCSDQVPEDSCVCVECYHGDAIPEIINTYGVSARWNSKYMEKPDLSAQDSGTCEPANYCRREGCCGSSDLWQKVDQTSCTSEGKAADSSEDSTCKSENSLSKDDREKQNSAPLSCNSQPNAKSGPCCREGNVGECCITVNPYQTEHSIKPQSSCGEKSLDEVPNICKGLTCKGEGCCNKKNGIAPLGDNGSCSKKEQASCAQNKQNPCCSQKSFACSKSCCDSNSVCEEGLQSELKDSSGKQPDYRPEVACKGSCCSNKNGDGYSLKETREAQCALGQQNCCGPPKSTSRDPFKSSSCKCTGGAHSGPSRGTSLECCGRPTVAGSYQSCATSDGNNGLVYSCDAEIACSTSMGSEACDTCQTSYGTCQCSTSQHLQPLQVDNMIALSREDNCCKSKSCCKPKIENGAVCIITNDSCLEQDDCKVSCKDCMTRNKAHSKVSITDSSGFYPTTPPRSPCVKPVGVEDSGEKKSQPKLSTTKLRVQNICCALESKLVQDSLEPLKGVTSVAVNVIGRVVYVRHDPEVTSATELVNTLNRNHLGACIMESGSHHHDDGISALPRVLTSFAVYLVIQTVLMLVAVVAFFSGESWSKWVAIAEMIFGIAPVLKKTFVSVKTLTVDINILMLIAIAGTVAIKEWLDGAAVVYVFCLAEALQEFCMYKVQRTISGLMLEAPQVAILASSGECIPVEQVAIGTSIAVRPGELIPLDGVVVNGRAAVDESSITGESAPIEKIVDSIVFSGTVNQNGYLEVKTTSDSSSSTVSKVAQLVQEAQTGASRTEEFINRFAKYYTPVVVVAAVLVVAVPAILGAAGVGNYLQEIRNWGRKALVILVIACPCALVMSTPIAVVCGITSAARKGALVKGGVHLETLAQMNVLAFDKTGTLTEGKFQVVGIECTFGVHERATLRLAAALESKSSHPLAAAIVNESAGCVAEMVKTHGGTLPKVSRFRLHEGQGISGVVDGHLVQIGNYEFLNVVGETLSKFMEVNYKLWSQQSKTVIFVCVNGELAMMMALADTVRPNCHATLSWLRELGVQTAMITGDNSRTALAVKETLSLDECIAEMKPQDKLSWIRRRQDGEQVFEDEARDNHVRHGWELCCLRGRYHVLSRDHAKKIVCMVGDGVNDGPALAAANIGIAMGAGGTALAVEAADVALMSNNLAKIPELVALARFCRRVVAQNIAFSVILKLVIVIAALAGKAALWMAVMADVLGLLFVILNGLRPLWWKVSSKGVGRNVDLTLDFAKNSRPIYMYETVV